MIYKHKNEISCNNARFFKIEVKALLHYYDNR